MSVCAKGGEQLNTQYTLTCPLCNRKIEGFLYYTTIGLNDNGDESGYYTCARQNCRNQIKKATGINAINDWTCMTRQNYNKHSFDSWGESYHNTKDVVTTHLQEKKKRKRSAGQPKQNLPVMKKNRTKESPKPKPKPTPTIRYADRLLHNDMTKILMNVGKLQNAVDELKLMVRKCYHGLQFGRPKSTIPDPPPDVNPQKSTIPDPPPDVNPQNSTIPDPPPDVNSQKSTIPDAPPPDVNPENLQFRIVLLTSTQKIYNCGYSS